MVARRERASLFCARGRLDAPVPGRSASPLGATSVTYRCATCRGLHEGLPDVAYRWPDPYFDVPESERSSRVRGDSDTCARDFFIRGVILIPIKETSDHFGVGVWVSQKRENFETYLKNSDMSGIGPFFGWLCNTLPFYESSTWALKTRAHFQGNNQRPLIEIAPCDHPLYLDYSAGVTLERAWQLYHTRERSRGT